MISNFRIKLRISICVQTGAPRYALVADNGERDVWLTSQLGNILAVLGCSYWDVREKYPYQGYGEPMYIELYDCQSLLD